MTSTTRSGLRVVRDNEGPQYPRASMLLRAGARLVDLAIALAVYRSTGPAGIVMAFLYLLFADGMLQGQSPGKKLFGVKVLYLPTRQGARHRDSVLRNSPFGLVILLSMMPELGTNAFFIGAAVVFTIEIVKCVKDPQGMRLGDIWAQTQVIDGKIPASQVEFAPASQRLRAPAQLKDVSPMSSSPTDEKAEE